MKSLFETYLFYDLETTGRDSKESQIIQFAAQRTDADLNPLGEPVNLLIKPLADKLPSPEAVLVHGITPQKALAEGITEAEFLKIFHKNIATPETTFVGFNSIRFDDEFMRNINYRNFYDPYEWHWNNGNSRWDILDVVRMTRALRPDGINWPKNENGDPTNTLEKIAEANNLLHENAHDALSDVLATIAVAKMIRDKKPKLMDYQYDNRKKARLNRFFDSNQNFIYTSGSIPKQFNHTTIMTSLFRPNDRTLIAYDLRHDPTEFIQMSVEEMVECLKPQKDKTAKRLPVKQIMLNKCPAVAPVGIAQDLEVQDRIQLSTEVIDKNLLKLNQDLGHFSIKVIDALEIVEKERKARYAGPGKDVPADQKIYEGFYNESDRKNIEKVRSSSPAEINDMYSILEDPRLKEILPIYKARNHPEAMTAEERAAYESYCHKQLFSGGENSKINKYFKSIGELATREDLSTEQRYLLEELRLYGESILP